EETSSSAFLPSELVPMKTATGVARLGSIVSSGAPRRTSGLALFVALVVAASPPGWTATIRTSIESEAYFGLPPVVPDPAPPDRWTGSLGADPSGEEEVGVDSGGVNSAGADSLGAPPPLDADPASASADGELEAATSELLAASAAALAGPVYCCLKGSFGRR